jgi:nitrite reductase/ring-hydroxylating ferredoxin subunit
VAVDDLGASQVVVVERTAHGALAVGVSAGKPFAVSNHCRHLFTPLAGAVKATTGARALKTFPVEVRDGAIWLVG